MDITTARAIYANPKGHSKVELRECLEVLNEEHQPVALSPLQFAAVFEAHNRLGIVLEPCDE